MTELKPCPFCGGEASHNGGGNSQFGRLWWSVWCDRCQFEVRDREVWDEKRKGFLDAACPPKECFTTWNTRATPWQPIETAPKDGTPILCISEGTHPISGNKYIPAVVEWHFGKWRDPDNDFEIDAGVFTHWMPLPSPPKDTGQ